MGVGVRRVLPRTRVSSNRSKEESGTREKSVSEDFSRLTLNAKPALGCWGKTRLRPPVQGASPSLGRRGPGAQQAGPGAQRCPCPSHFSLPGIGEHRAGRHQLKAGSSAGATAGTAGRQDRAAQQPAPGARGQQEQPSGLDPGPATRPPAWVPAQHTQGGCAPRATAGTDDPTAGNSTTWRPPLHRARAAIATHRGRLGSGPPIRVALSFPGEPCPAAARGHGRCARAGWGRLVLRLHRDRRRLPSSGLCCNVCEADFERLARRPPAAAALLPPPPSSRRPGPSPRCSTPFSSSAKFLNPFLPLPPIVTRVDRVPGGSLELGSLSGSCRPPLRCSGWETRGCAALKVERGHSSTGKGGCLALRAGALAFRPRPAAWTDCP
ncbi:hypothetical protein NN561_014018 [Cricetulus griseus]